MHIYASHIDTPVLLDALSATYGIVSAIRLRLHFTGGDEESEIRDRHTVCDTRDLDIANTSVRLLQQIIDKEGSDIPGYLKERTQEFIDTVTQLCESAYTLSCDAPLIALNWDHWIATDRLAVRMYRMTH